MARWSFILSACWLGLMLAPASGIQMLGSISVYTQDMPNTIVDEFPDQLATFGPGLPEDGLRSMLVLADPPDGCYPLAPPPSEHFTTEKWTVLIARFNCTFEKKIRNAQAAGFDCAIVHNVNSSELETMSTMHPAGIDIPSVFVSDITGHQLGHDYTYSDGYFVLVQASQGPSLDPDDAMNTRLPLLFVVGGLCVLTMTGIVLVKYICNRRARAQPPWRPLHAPPLEKGAPRDDKLPAFLTTFTGPPKTKSKEEEANQAGCVVYQHRDMARWSFILSACWLGLMLAPTSGIQMSGFIDVYVVASAYSQDVSIAVNTYHVQLAKFGPRLTKDGLRSMLVRADPPDGCSALAPPPSEKFTFTEKWTVLIDRGNCTFETKIRNAQAAGFDCAIVHDLDDSELAELETMTAKDIVGIDIPSVFATGSTGFQLGGLFTYSNGYYVVVRAPPDAPLDPKEAMNTRLLLLAVGALCVFWIVLVKYICNRRARALPSWRPLHAPPLEKAGNYKTPTFLTTFTGPPKTKSKEEEAKQHFSATAP